MYLPGVKTPAGIASGICEARKPPNYDKVTTLWGEGHSSSHVSTDAVGRSIRYWGSGCPCFAWDRSGSAGGEVTQAVTPIPKDGQVDVCVRNDVALSLSA